MGLAADDEEEEEDEEESTPPIPDGLSKGTSASASAEMSLTTSSPSPVFARAEAEAGGERSCVQVMSFFFADSVDVRCCGSCDDEVRAGSPGTPSAEDAGGRDGRDEGGIDGGVAMASHGLASLESDSSLPGVVSQRLNPAISFTSW